MIPLLITGGLLLPSPIARAADAGLLRIKTQARDLDDWAKRKNQWMGETADTLLDRAAEAERLADRLDPGRTATGNELAARLRASAKQMRTSAAWWKTGPLKTFNPK
jgi:hypothetical protein